MEDIKIGASYHKRTIKQEYIDYPKWLNSEEWGNHKFGLISRRKRLLGHDRCELCKEGGGIIVHHLHYKRLKNERINDYRLVCFACHQGLHLMKKKQSDWQRAKIFNYFLSAYSFSKKMVSKNRRKLKSSLYKRKRKTA